MPQNVKHKAQRSKAASPKSSITDARFSALTSNPRYRLPSKKRTHIKLDSRLSAILKEDSFSRKASVDRYGRKTSKSQPRKDLQRLYQLASDDEDDEADEKYVKIDDANGTNKQDDDAAVQAELDRIGKKYDPARDGGFSTSESESESEPDDSDSEEEEILDAELPELPDQVPMGDVSRRIAMVNLDWDNISAQDIMCVASSFVPTDGKILSVAIYPSQFGRERMEREEFEGPPKEIFQSTTIPVPGLPAPDPEDEAGTETDDSSSDERVKKDLLQEDMGVEFDSVALRKYQLDRLRYYYAVISCSTAVVAQALYTNMDGQEYLHSANFFDLRFVPDDVNFDDDKPRELCKKVTEGYKPTQFTTDALMHSKVKLTWDADDPKRKEIQKRAFSRKEIDENDMLAYIGSASSESDDDDDENKENDVTRQDDQHSDDEVKSTTSRATTRQARREAMRMALGLDVEYVASKKQKEEERHVGDMQITFTPALSSTTPGQSVFENEPIIEESTADKYIRKERERKAQRKERAKARRGILADGELPETRALPATEAAVDEADGFNDRFFDNPDAHIKLSREARKAQKAKLKRQASDGSSDVYQAQNPELELIMMDDQGGSTNQHFDMKVISKKDKKAQKSAKRNKKASKSTSKGGDEAQDGFKVDVQDDRFSRLFEDPMLAIDPTDSRYRDTQTMRNFLGEKRRRKEREEENKTKRVRRLDGAEQDMEDAISRIERRKRA